MPPPLCGLNGHRARGGRRGRPEAEPSRRPRPPRAPLPGQRSGRRRVPGAAGHEAPPPAARPRGRTLFRMPPPSALWGRAGGGPSASPRRERAATPRPVRGVDAAPEPRETFLSRGAGPLPGAARDAPLCAAAARTRSPGGLARRIEACIAGLATRGQDGPCELCQPPPLCLLHPCAPGCFPDQDSHTGCLSPAAAAPGWPGSESPASSLPRTGQGWRPL